MEICREDHAGDRKVIILLNGEYDLTRDLAIFLKSVSRDEPVLLVADKYFPNALSRYVDLFVVINNEALLASFLKVASRKYGSKIIPTGFKSWKLATVRGIDIPFEVSSDHILELSDKRKVLSMARDRGIPVPNEGDSASFPLFVKSSSESMGKLRRIVLTADELEVYREGVEEGKYIVQEFLPDPRTLEISVLFSQGRIEELCFYEELISYPFFGGNGVFLHKIEPDAILRRLPWRLLDGIDYDGPLLIELKRRGEDYVLMEVNPKLWASIYFTFRSCPNLKKKFLKRIFGELRQEGGASSCIIPVNSLLYPARFLLLLLERPSVMSIVPSLIRLYLGRRMKIKFDWRDLPYELSLILWLWSVYLLGKLRGFFGSLIGAFRAMLSD